MLQVRIKKVTTNEIIPALFFGKIIYPGDNWITIDDKYLDAAKAEDRIEIFTEEKVEQPKEQVKIESVKTVVTTIDMKVNGNQGVDLLIQELLTIHYAQAKAKIKKEITDVNLLKDKLLPAFELANKDGLINVTKERIEELSV